MDNSPDISIRPLKINVDLKKESEEETNIKACLKKHPKGYVLIVFKSSRRLYVCKNGKVIENRAIKKSSLDSEYHFLKGSPDDQININSPIPIALGRRTSGAKQQAHDSKTPEGEYFVCRKDAKGQTAFSAALAISYPNLKDAQEAKNNGVISSTQYRAIKRRLAQYSCPPYTTPLGGGVKIHGPDTKFLNELKSAYPEKYRRYLTQDQPDYQRLTDRDWTKGCIALERSAIFYLFRVIPPKTPVIIFE